MFYKVKNVIPKNNYILSVLFTDGIEMEYDIKPLFDKWIAFKSLKDIPGLYNQVKVDIGGYGISWNDELDLEGNELRENGRIVCKK